MCQTPSGYKHAPAPALSTTQYKCCQWTPLFILLVIASSRGRLDFMILHKFSEVVYKFHYGVF